MASEQPERKHGLDWFLGGIACVSIILNIVQFTWQAEERSITRPGPLIYRLTMPATDGDLFAAAAENKDVFFDQFPKPKIHSSDTLKKAREDLRNMDNIVIRDTLLRFLVVRNVTDEAYTDVKLLLGGKTIEEVGTIDANSTCFVYYANEDDLRSAVIQYTIHGTTNQLDSRIPTKGKGESALPLMTVATGMSVWGSLEGFDKTDRLYEFRNSDAYELPAE